MESEASPQLQTASISQLKRVCRHHLRALWNHPADARAIAPIMVWGPPGVGKSQAFRQVCAEEQIGFLDIRLAQREPVDIRGLPVPQGDHVTWLISGEWPREGRGIILFDELTSADRSLQVAAYEFLLDRRLGDLYAVPPGWYICAAGNRQADRAIAWTLSSALANRFCHVEVSAGIEDWMLWALPAGIHPVVTGFLRAHPELLFALPEDENVERGWPSPRSWERVSFALQEAERTGLDDLSLRLIVQGLVGPSASTRFLRHRAVSRRATEVEAMLRGQQPWQVPETADERLALVSVAVYLAHGDASLVPGMLDLSSKLSSDFATVCLIDYLNAGGPDAVAERAQRTFALPAFARWKEVHGRVFSARFGSVGGP